MGGILNMAGAETIVVNYLQNIDSNKFHIDFVLYGNHIGDYSDIVTNKGCKVYFLGSHSKIIHNYRILNNIFCNNHYDIVHAHANATSALALLVAKKNNVKIRIAHSHSAGFSEEKKARLVYLKLLRVLTNRNCNVRFACSRAAGDFLFGKHDYIIINNAIDLSKFKFDEDARKKYRKQLNIPDEIKVILHVGRFIYVKNHKFLIDIFAKALQLNPNLILVLIGTGVNKSSVQNQCKEKNIIGHVIFLEPTDKVNKLYSMADMFILPSLFEGLPTVGVEAQASGLPCLFSDKVTPEVDLLDTTCHLSLQASENEWSKKIVEMVNHHNKRLIDEKYLRKFDIVSNAKRLEQIYMYYLKNE